MTNSQRLAVVRQCLLHWLNENAAATRADSQTDSSDSIQGDGKHENVSAEEIQITRESILVRNDFFCGRRFRTADHNAVWFIEEDQLKIYQHDGQLLIVLTGQEIDDAIVENQEPKIIAFPAATIEAAAEAMPARKAA